MTERPRDLSDEDLLELLRDAAVEQRRRVEQDKVQIRERIAARIVDGRKARGLSQAELAAMIDRSRTTVVNIEQCKQGIPIEVLIDIAAALHTTIEQLIKRVDP